MSNNKYNSNNSVSSVRTGGKSRPSLTRAETIESCNSDDLVTVLEVHDRKPYKIMDRRREMKKGVMAESLEELIERGKEKLNYPMDKPVYVVLEEDGTEVDEEEYFQTLPENTLLMLLHLGDKWSPFGPPFTTKKISSQQDASDEPDFGSGYYQVDLHSLLERLAEDPGYIALLSGKELELLAEMDPDEFTSPSSASRHGSTSRSSAGASKDGGASADDASDYLTQSDSAQDCSASARYTRSFLTTIQRAADRHLQEKNEIRDALGLLKIYHRASSAPANRNNKDETDSRARSAEKSPKKSPENAEKAFKTSPKNVKKSSKTSPKNAEKSKSSSNIENSSTDGATCCVYKTRQSLSVLKSSQSSIEASPHKRRRDATEK